MADNDLQIVIAAVDHATATLKAVQKNLGNMPGSAKKVDRSLKDLGKNGTIKKLGLDVSALGREALASAGKIAFMSPALEMLAGLGTATGLAAMTVQTAKVGQSLTRMSAITGQSAETLQTWGKAAELSGASSEAMVSSLKGITTVANDAQWGRNNQALVFMDNYGISLRRTADGAVDAVDLMKQIASILPRLAPETRRDVLSMFGIDESMIPLLMKGAGSLEKFRERVDALGGTMNEQQIRRANAFAESVTSVGLAAEGMIARLSQTKLAKGATDWAAKFIGDMNLRFDVVSRGLGWNADDEGAGPKGSGPQKKTLDPKISSVPSAQREKLARESFDFWTSKGYSPAQAAGLVANEDKESKFNSAAVGDSGHARGLFQWHEDRQAAILKGTGIDVTTADHQKQLEAAYWELNQGGEQKANAALLSSRTASNAGWVISRNFERPAASEEEAAVRAGMAKSWLANLTGQGATQPASDQTSTPETSGVAGALDRNTQALQQNTQAVTQAQGSGAGSVSMPQHPGMATRVNYAMPDGALP